MECLYLKYSDVVQDPITNSNAIVKFLNADLDLDAMSEAVDASLYRNKLMS